MSVGRTSRFFKFVIFAALAVILMITATRQSISQTVQQNENNAEKTFLDQIREKISGKNEEEDPYKIKEANAKEVINNNSGKNQQSENRIANEENTVDEQEEEDIPVPLDDSMPAAYLRFLEPAPTNKSYCHYNYELPYDLVYTGKHYLFPPQLGKESPYRVIHNVTEAYGIQNASQVTYATHMTANFAYFIPELLKQWEGLIVVAAFVPDLDVAFFLEQIIQFCYCEPEMYRVSIHIVTHKFLPFSKKDIYFDRPDNCIPQDSSKVAIYKEYDETVIYPVNVLRNVARTSALTKYVFLSDIELMPSKGLASRFLQMIQYHNNSSSTKEVFVVPIFEVEETESIPENKQDLIKLVKDKKAVYFHELVCKHCQLFPGIEDWMKTVYSENIKPLITVKRQDPYNRWEPIFIGTNEEPLYSEPLSWEGLQDKMTQSLEMCLLNYNYTILDNAFLCHWPGIKKEKVVKEEWRADYVEQNREAYKVIIENLLSRYEDIPGCKVNYTTDALPGKKIDPKSVKR